MRKTLLLSSLALMLFCTTPAVAQLKPGAWAPDIEVKSWMNYSGGQTLAELRGRVVFIEFWATW